jgi:hypothetical protein
MAERLHQVQEDKRGIQAPIPSNLGRYLNEAQFLALRSLENFGWALAFVRRPLFMTPVVVVASPDSAQYALLEDDGSVNMKSGLQLRH